MLFRLRQPKHPLFLRLVHPQGRSNPPTEPKRPTPVKAPSGRLVGQRRPARPAELAPVAPLDRKPASSLPEATDQIGQSFKEKVWIGSNQKLGVSGSLPLAPHHLSAAGCEFHTGQVGAQPPSEVLICTGEVPSTNTLFSVSLFVLALQSSALCFHVRGVELHCCTLPSRFCF